METCINLRIDCDFIQQWYALPDQPLQSVQRIYNRITGSSHLISALASFSRVFVLRYRCAQPIFECPLELHQKSVQRGFILGGTWNVYGETDTGTQ